jgi:hypothetical protein
MFKSMCQPAVGLIMERKLNIQYASYIRAQLSLDPYKVTQLTYHVPHHLYAVYKTPTAAQAHSATPYPANTPQSP